MLDDSIDHTFGCRAVVAGDAIVGDAGVAERGFPRQEGRISVAGSAVLAVDWNMWRGHGNKFARGDGLRAVMAAHAGHARDNGVSSDCEGDRREGREVRRTVTCLAIRGAGHWNMRHFGLGNTLGVHPIMAGGAGG